MQRKYIKIPIIKNQIYFNSAVRQQLHIAESIEQPVYQFFYNNVWYMCFEIPPKYIPYGIIKQKKEDIWADYRISPLATTPINGTLFAQFVDVEHRLIKIVGTLKNKK